MKKTTREILSDCVKAGMSFDDTLTAIYLTGLENGIAVARDV